MTPNSASVAATRWVVAARKCCAENPADASFCKQCGTRLGGIAAPPTAAARSERISVSAEQADIAALDGVRKTVTALFADIKGSMDFYRRPRPRGSKRHHRPGASS
jgi:hypothetical protein